MKRTPTALIAALAIVFAATAVLFYARWNRAEELASRLEAERSAALARATTAESLLASLRSEFEALTARRLELESSLALATARVEEAGADDEETVEEVSIEPAVLRSDPVVLGSLAEADGIYTQALEDLDLETLWLLAADLLALGEPGYEKLIELFARLEADGERFQAAQSLWSSEEIIIGPFLQTVAERHEDILRFGLFLASKDADALPSPLSEVQGELTDELGSVFLGFYRGDDPAILNGYLELYRQSIEKEPDDDLILGLASIPTEAATDLLLELASRPLEKRALQAVVRALAWKRAARAVPLLLDLRDNTADPETRELIGTALRYLGR